MTLQIYTIPLPYASLLIVGLLALKRISKTDHNFRVLIIEIIDYRHAWPLNFTMSDSRILMSQTCMSINKRKTSSHDNCSGLVMLVNKREDDKLSSLLFTKPEQPITQYRSTASCSISQYVCILDRVRKHRHVLSRPHFMELFYIVNYIGTFSVCAALIIHWASKETYNFLEWCPPKSTASKWMIFGLMLATVLLITHVKKTKKSKVQKMR